MNILFLLSEKKTILCENTFRIVFRKLIRDKSKMSHAINLHKYPFLMKYLKIMIKQQTICELKLTKLKRRKYKTRIMYSE